MASFSVVSNIASSNAQAKLYDTQLGLQKALTRLSSGLRINVSGDDAAGLAVANTYRNDAVVLNQGIRNANDGLSLLQVKDGALGNVASLLDRLSTLATQAASAGTSGVSIQTLQDEADAILGELSREISVAKLTESGFSVFISNDGENGVVSGTLKSISLEVAPDDDADENTVYLGIQVTSGEEGEETTGFIDLATNAAAAVATLKEAVGMVAQAQGAIGSLQNKLQFAVSLAQSQQVNKLAAESRIRDANIAEETANMTRYNILTQSGIAALAQANQSTSAVLALLR